MWVIHILHGKHNAWIPRTGAPQASWITQPCCCSLTDKPNHPKIPTKPTGIRWEIFSFDDHFLYIAQTPEKAQLRVLGVLGVAEVPLAWGDGEKTSSVWQDGLDTWHCLFVSIPQGHSIDTMGSCLPGGAFPSWRSKTRGWMVGPPCPEELQSPGCLGIQLQKQRFCTEF